MSLREYPDYRDSGVDWLGQVPTDWTVQPLRNVTDFTTGWTPPTGNADSYDGDFLWANISDLGPKHLSGTAKNLSAAAIAASNIPLSPKGSLLFSFKLTIGSVSIVGADMYTNEAIATFHASEFLSVEYAYYALPICVVRNASENIYGAPMLNARLIRSARIAIPPIVQQRQIADYLDAHTAKIDMLIGKQERLIETLAERRQAVISHAVTKGLDLDASFRDSGSVWFPSIPAHWALVPCAASSLLIQTGPFGSQLHSDEYVSGGTPVINPSHIVDGKIVPSDAITVDGDRERDLERHRLRIGDIVAARRGEMGRCAAVDDQSHGYLCGTGSLIIRLRPDSYVPAYFQLIFSSEENRATLTERSVGATMDNLNADIVARLRLPCPPVAEQQDIIAHLDRETAQMDALSAKAGEMIDVLKERRQALISGAVTGKIDVRGLA